MTRWLTISQVCQQYPVGRTKAYEPECTCYEYHGGHGMGCPFYSRGRP